MTERETYKQELLNKTRLCRHYAQGGICPNGANCMFAHGEAELRVRSHSSYAAQASYAPQMYAPQAYAPQPQAYAPQPYAVQPQAYAPQVHTLARTRTLASVSARRSLTSAPPRCSPRRLHGLAGTARSAPAALLGTAPVG